MYKIGFENITIISKTRDEIPGLQPTQTELLSEDVTILTFSAMKCQQTGTVPQIRLFIMFLQKPN